MHVSFCYNISILALYSERGGCVFTRVYARWGGGIPKNT